ncbi:hypothetical protein LJC68_00415 [Bacteroidales bacterium OttesenSCG-928-B11]|nr:hypothetical protein [Bacteroidales bacterium OttesenSCG-928-B11]MDL2326054.1 hypothetical protein [Bacteroidales bacterium OttesenSCG-928-A14]
MKKNKLLILSAILVVFCIACEREKEFDPTLLHGKWKQNTLFEVYKSDGTGYTWDEADDVTEEEAQPFEWSLNKDKLEHIHIMEMGGRIPKNYKVTELNSTTLQYEDTYDRSYNFTKMQ